MQKYGDKSLGVRNVVTILETEVLLMRYHTAK